MIHFLNSFLLPFQENVFHQVKLHIVYNHAGMCNHGYTTREKERKRHTLQSSSQDLSGSTIYSPFHPFDSLERLWFGDMGKSSIVTDGTVRNSLSIQISLRCRSRQCSTFTNTCSEGKCNCLFCAFFCMLRKLATGEALDKNDLFSCPLLTVSFVLLNCNGSKLPMLLSTKVLVYE